MLLEKFLDKYFYDSNFNRKEEKRDLTLFGGKKKFFRKNRKGNKN